jgi:hypothetical protein
MSRHLAKLSCADVIVHFPQDVVELARSDIALHLLIPFVVFPAMEPGSKLGPLFKRELFYGGLDLVNAHGLNDKQEYLSPQRVESQVVRDQSQNNRGRPLAAGRVWKNLCGLAP